MITHIWKVHDVWKYCSGGENMMLDEGGEVYLFEKGRESQLEEERLH